MAVYFGQTPGKLFLGTLSKVVGKSRLLLLTLFSHLQYNIGDRIHISNPEIDCDRNGSPGKQ